MTRSAVLIVEDDANLRAALFDTLASDEQPVFTADNGATALEIIDSSAIGLVVTDWQMEPMDGMTLLSKIREQHPTLPAVMMSAHGTIRNAVDVMRSGASDYLVKPFEAKELKAIVDKYLKSSDKGDTPIAADAATVELLQIAKRVASTDVTVTISGPSGSGKEVFARYIHEQSPRKDQPFVAINCAAIPETMLEAVLFGYEQASGGTLLLDEISEMDIGLQAKLLRVIQEKEVERIGGRKIIPLDVRVLATTNRDLRAYVRDGKFREDLYYRLNVFPLHLKPLAERRDDILPLAEMALERHSDRVASLSDCARDALLRHSWPGNVRELENVIQRSLILHSGPELAASDLVFESQPGPGANDGDLGEGLRSREFQLIHEALLAHDGKRADVAKALGISARSLRYKLARMRADGLAIPGESS